MSLKSSSVYNIDTNGLSETRFNESVRGSEVNINGYIVYRNYHRKA